jgi:hypothetical protein
MMTSPTPKLVNIIIVVVSAVKSHGFRKTTLYHEEGG